MIYLTRGTRAESVCRPPTSALEQLDHDHPRFPHRFSTADDLEAITRGTGLSIAGVVRANERAAMRGTVQAAEADAAVKSGLGRIWGVMEGCIDEGLRSSECSANGSPNQPFLR